MIWNDFMRVAGLDPWRELQDLHSQMNCVFTAIPRSGLGASEFPPIEVWTGEEGLLLRARLPALTPEQIELSVVDETLTLKGELPGPETSDAESYHRRERGSGRFVRTIQLPFPVEGEKVKARFQDGILEVELPRAASDKPRKIPVKNA